MKVVVCQGEAIGGSPSREDLLSYWKEQFLDCPDIEVVYRKGFDFEHIGEIVEDADALLGAWIRDDFFKSSLRHIQNSSTLLLLRMALVKLIRRQPKDMV